MQIKTKAIDAVNASLSAKIPSADVKSKLENAAKKAAKNMKIDGFRAGKVPVNVVLKRYEKELTADAEQDALKDVIDAGLKELNRKFEEVIGEPIVTKFDRGENEIDAEIELSFKPVINIDGYEELIESVSKFDFEGFVDSVAFEGGKAENYLLEIGSGQFIPGFEDGMIGLKVGEERDVKVKFPAEYGAAHLAGKDATFKVKLHEIQGKKVPEEIDEETLKRIMPGEEKVSVELFEERLKEQIKAEKHAKNVNEELKPKFADAIVAKFNFDVPKNIVEQEMDMQFRSAWSSFTPEQMAKFREDKDALTKQRETYRDDAVKSVKLTFIIDELARRRDIKVSDQELIQAVYFEAYRSGVDPKQHLENYKNQGILPAIKMSMIEEKLFNEMFALKSDKKEKKAE